ncbi:toluene hydroxylase [Nocardia miyunensis]|uniref:toluene hydroxylase n=1 Tax=Nocardia miyunensis TaxID=282684 RepID=UPI000832E8C4|nr:toluene hydroxylase [Nocardia miyunensis]
MSENATGRPRRRRTFSAFGDVRRMPTEYEIVTHGQNWTVRSARNGAFEQNPSSAPNLWFDTYRDNSAFRARDWDAFRAPDKFTYRMYVNAQAESEHKVQGVLEQFGDIDADARLAPGWVRTLAGLYTPSRYPTHGFQQVEAYIGYMAPTSYVNNAAALATADLLRRVTTLAYRTRQLQIAHPDSGIGTAAEGELWRTHEFWQPLRRTLETALATYDWGEAFVAHNLVLLPTIQDVLCRQLGEIARVNGDDQTWLIEGLLAADRQRRDTWSRALLDMVLTQQPGTGAVVDKWLAKWAPRADDAATAIAGFLAAAPEHPRTVEEIGAEARAAREHLLNGLLGRASDAPGADVGIEVTT